jgi:hypothetical protein
MRPALPLSRVGKREGMPKLKVWALHCIAQAIMKAKIHFIKYCGILLNFGEAICVAAPNFRTEPTELSIEGGLFVRTDRSNIAFDDSGMLGMNRLRAVFQPLPSKVVGGLFVLHRGGRGLMPARVLFKIGMFVSVFYRVEINEAANERWLFWGTKKANDVCT